MTREQVQNLHYRFDGRVSAEKVGFLEDALALLADYPETQRLQVDLKPFTPLAPAVLQALLTLIEPVKARVQVTSVGDWAIRALAAASPQLSLGFDPLLYLDLPSDEPRPKDIPPFRAGAYGLLDDHPLSAFRWGSLADYFAARASALLTQVPRGCDWFIRAEVLETALQAGFDWIAFLHQAGALVDAWTIHVRQHEQVERAKFLVARGLDALTTDTPAQLADLIPVKSIV
jgi:glycerophosphoryl diester phosphodiesterase